MQIFFVVFVIFVVPSSGSFWSETRHRVPKLITPARVPPELRISLSSSPRFTCARRARAALFLRSCSGDVDTTLVRSVPCRRSRPVFDRHAVRPTAPGSARADQAGHCRRQRPPLLDFIAVIGGETRSRVPALGGQRRPGPGAGDCVGRARRFDLGQEPCSHRVWQAARRSARRQRRDHRNRSRRSVVARVFVNRVVAFPRRAGRGHRRCGSRVRVYPACRARTAGRHAGRRRHRGGGDRFRHCRLRRFRLADCCRVRLHERGKGCDFGRRLWTWHARGRTDWRQRKPAGRGPISGNGPAGEADFDEGAGCRRRGAHERRHPRRRVRDLPARCARHPDHQPLARPSDLRSRVARSAGSRGRGRLTRRNRRRRRRGKLRHRPQHG